jgi:4-hydroxybenzoate polyprenyltransferase
MKWVAAFRLHQWAKNLVVLVPAAITGSGWMAATEAALVFCVLASATYCLNDVLDREADRQHPRKRRRPFASGAIRPEIGMCVGQIGVLVALGLGLLISLPVFWLLCCYTGVTVGYSLMIKPIPVLDAATIGVLFVIRLLTGAEAINWAPPVGLLAITFFGFTSAAAFKRFVDW